MIIEGFEKALSALDKARAGKMWSSRLRLLENNPGAAVTHFLSLYFQFFTYLKKDFSECFNSTPVAVFEKGFRVTILNFMGLGEGAGFFVSGPLLKQRFSPNGGATWRVGMALP
jgi:hypothetical protein